MLYLIIAITFGSLFAILFKIFQRRGIDALQAIAVNYVVAFALGMLGNVSQGFSATGIGSWILPTILVGLFMMASFVTMNMATRSHGIAIATIAARVAFIVPVLCAYLFLQGNEPRWIASALVIASLLLIFPQQDGNKSASRQWAYPLLVFACYGITNFLLKLSQQLVANAGGSDADLSLVTGIAFLSALLFTLLYYLSTPRTQRAPLSWRNAVAGIVLGCVNVGCTYFLLKSLMVIDSGIFYPTYNIAIVTIATLVGRIGFGERLKAVQYAGIAVAILAIILFFC
jgi:multidrug transporter EmrE-like cation transporter